MAPKANKSIPVPADPIQKLLEVLQWACVAEGWTLSVYTSKKGRKWVAVKSFAPRVCGTSVEIPVSASLFELSLALLVAFYEHVEKQYYGVPMYDTWVAWPIEQFKIDEAYEWANEKLAELVSNASEMTARSADGIGSSDDAF